MWWCLKIDKYEECSIGHILSRQRRESYDSKEGKIESKVEDGDPVPIFPRFASSKD